MQFLKDGVKTVDELSQGHKCTVENLCFVPFCRRHFCPVLSNEYITACDLLLYSTLKEFVK